jgi:hypothetical protein
MLQVCHEFIAETTPQVYAVDWPKARAKACALLASSAPLPEDSLSEAQRSAHMASTLLAGAPPLPGDEQACPALPAHHTAAHLSGPHSLWSTEEESALWRAIDRHIVLLNGRGQISWDKVVEEMEGKDYHRSLSALKTHRQHLLA